MGAAFGLLGIIIAINLVGAQVLKMFELLVPGGYDAAFMVVYLVAYMVTLKIGLTFRRSNRIVFKSGPGFMWPLLFVLTALFLLVREPLLSLFQGPVPRDQDLISGLDIVSPFFVVITVFAAPIFEELIFRGIILHGFLKRQPPWRAILISSLLFAIAHLNLPQFVNALMLGIMIGWVYWKTESLWLCVLIHFVNNLCATLLLYYYDPYRSAIIQMAKSMSSFWMIYICGFILVVILGVLLYRYYEEKENSLMNNENNN